MFTWSLFTGKKPSGTDMRAYTIQVIPKIRCFSLRLGEFSAITDYNWVLFTDKKTEPVTFIFRPSGKLLVHRNNSMEAGKWEITGDRSLILETGGKTYLFRVDFMDHTLVALSYNHKEEYVVLINDTKTEIFLNNINRINSYLRNTYFTPNHKSDLNPLKTIYNSKVRYTVDKCEFCDSYISRHARDVFKIGYYQICLSCAEEHDHVTRHTNTVPVSTELSKMSNAG